jgi:release factor glutamine methyltransferase
MNLDQIIRQDSGRLKDALGLDVDEARIEVQCLLQAVLKVSRPYLMTYPERDLNADETRRYTGLVERRLRGEPVAYLLGEREFFGHAFRVTKDTLIPRQDTELLVELALQHIQRQHVRRVLDMGTGSGAIAISIAHEKPDIEVVALDASKAALEVAAENAGALGVCNLRFLHSDWYAAIGGERFDLIVSNPPYIAANDGHLQDLGYEPDSALVSGVDGLDDIRRIIGGAMNHLNPEGWLMLEHGYDQAARVRDLLRQSGFSEVLSARDLSGVERVSMGRA